MHIIIADAGALAYTTTMEVLEIKREVELSQRLGKTQDYLLH